MTAHEPAALPAAALPAWLSPLAHGLDGIEDELRHRGGAVAALTRVRRPRKAAVLMLFEGTGDGDELPADATVLLTQRASALRQHAGQVAFPGGKRDEGDSDDVATALREAKEETGIDPASVRVLQTLHPIEVPVSSFIVTPVVATTTYPSEVGVVDPGETALVRRVPLAELLDPAHRFMVRKAGYRGPAFAVGPMLVWGFTGGLLNALLSSAGWEVPWDTGDVRDLGDELRRAAQRRRP
ncbi:CoA pyrophosphatase [Tsukamurella sp. 8F]|uniref:NUDIX hydrolase n=1 Tax=unclassified Tsukamurella TaxID=2633480 RepID=UPI0023B99E96|nr:MULTISPECIES: CoA pyrophosphatase [unclassified Tsukamurella]MDF0529605.1 CoA pyrophosphatase [Tsukamurella sp. 8J]MDF0585707.1 CoA pyrophosphatase [Tsukamurella sp. 8F]